MSNADSAGRRWVVLVAGMLAMAAGCTFQYGLAYLIPAFRAEGLSLEQASILVACPTAGLLLTLVAWGAAADRWGERLVLTAGLALAGAILLAASAEGGLVALGGCLGLAGAAGASVYAASGRLILGWFPARQRGLAMGIRQSAQPLGVMVAALVLPAVGAVSRPAALLFLGAFCVAGALLVALAVRDPARPPQPAGARRGSPYRGRPGRVLWRIHAASALLVVPQFAVATFALVFLVDVHGLAAISAGRLLAAAQACGAASRLGAGAWSDRVGSRLRPMRVLALAIALVTAALAAGAAIRAPWAAAALLAAVVLAVSTNGLSFTAVAEHAGSSWAGRALGVQNTGQNAFAAATPPTLAAVIGAAGYPAAFGIVALFPLAAAALLPVRGEGHSGQAESSREECGPRRRGEARRRRVPAEPAFGAQRRSGGPGVAPPG
ncbi:MAG TPA: MFS transporter [Streptosporangiaceae bacterium]|nr:MFS transporter [Streptosporangiaceae bacterium]